MLGGGRLAASPAARERTGNRIRSSRSRDKSIRSGIRRTPQRRRRRRLSPTAAPVSTLGRLGGAQRSCKGREASLEAFGGAGKAEYSSLAGTQALGDGCWSWASPAALPSRGRPSASEWTVVSPRRDPPVAGQQPPGSLGPHYSPGTVPGVRDTASCLGGTAAAGAVCPLQPHDASPVLNWGQTRKNREQLFMLTPGEGIGLLVSGC